VGEDGETRAIGSDDVNDYLQEASGADFTAKDFRTWAGSVRAAAVLGREEPPSGEVLARKNVVRAIKAVSEELGNTPAVSRSAYVHPEIIDAYLEGDLRPSSKARSASTEFQSLRAREAELVTLLRRRRRGGRQAASPSKRSSARR
jgi:DNA topoisomerase I